MLAGWESEGTVERCRSCMRLKRGVPAAGGEGDTERVGGKGRLVECSWGSVELLRLLWCCREAAAQLAELRSLLAVDAS